MLVAKRKLLTSWGTVEAGEPLPFPEKWDRIALQSTINVGWASEVEEIKIDVPPVPKEVLESKIASSVLTSEAICQDCNREFKSVKALKSHRGLKHK